jgi:hypothetical protein
MDHAFHIVQNILICESNHLVPMLDEVLGSLGIIGLSRFMRISINFDDQAQFPAEEVGIIRTYGHLPTEFPATDLSFGQIFPEFAFSGRGCIA